MDMLERFRRRVSAYGFWYGSLNFISAKLKRVKSSIISMRLRIVGVSLGHGVYFHASPLIKGVPSRIRIEDGCELEKGVVLWTHVASGQAKGRIHLARDSYLGIGTIINSYDAICIGEKTMIAAMCYLVDHDHGTVAGIPMQKQPLIHSPVVIGNDCWLGTGVTVVKGVTLRSGTVIGAGAVVTKDSEDSSIIVGLPARPIGNRAASKFN